MMTDVLATNVVNEVAVMAIQILGAVVLALLTFYGRKLLKRLEGKASAEQLTEADRLLSLGASYAVDFAEEKARTYVLDKTEKMTGLQKLDAAAEWFREHYRQQVVDWSEDKVRDYVLSRLGSKREYGGTGPYATPAPATNGEAGA